MNPLRSVRARLTFWYSALLAAILLIFCVSVYTVLQSGLHTALDAELADSVDIVENGLGAYLDQLSELEEHGALNLFQVRDGDHVVYQTRAWRAERLDDARAARDGPVWSWTSPVDHGFRLQSRAVDTAGRAFDVVVAQDRTAVNDGLRRLRLALLIGFPAALGVAMGGGWWLARRALAPVGAMAARSRAITAERLSDRLPVPPVQDEFGQLAGVFNDTFTRLERSFDQLRRFTADASHELRTPLTVLRSVGEVGLQKDRSTTELRDVIGSMLEESDRLSKLVDRLLMLSRMESGHAVPRRESVDAAALARHVVECLRALAEEKGQTLRLGGAVPVFVAADRALLRQALMNLVDNAVKYTPRGGSIGVDVSVRDRRVEIAVSDTGPGIPEEHHARVFDRFYRVDSGRSRDAGGTGLGLAITRWIVEQHGGTIGVSNAPDAGATFRVSLPAEFST